MSIFELCVQGRCISRLRQMVRQVRGQELRPFRHRDAQLRQQFGSGRVGIQYLAIRAKAQHWVGVALGEQRQPAPL